MLDSEIVPPTPEWIARNADRAEIVIDKNGNPLYARLKDTSVFGYLIEREILDHTHAHYAMVFEDMKRYFSRRVSYRSNGTYALEFFSSSNSGTLETAYVRVCRRIKGLPETCIKFCLENDATLNNRDIAWRSRERILSAFDLLMQTIDEVRADLDKTTD